MGFELNSDTSQYEWVPDLPQKYAPTPPPIDDAVGSGGLGLKSFLRKRPEYDINALAASSAPPLFGGLYSGAGMAALGTGSQPAAPPPPPPDEPAAGGDDGLGLMQYSGLARRGGMSTDSPLASGLSMGSDAVGIGSGIIGIAGGAGKAAGFLSKAAGFANIAGGVTGLIGLGVNWYYAHKQMKAQERQAKKDEAFRQQQVAEDTRRWDINRKLTERQLKEAERAARATEALNEKAFELRSTESREGISMKKAEIAEENRINGINMAIQLMIGTMNTFNTAASEQQKYNFWERRSAS